LFNNYAEYCGVRSIVPFALLQFHVTVAFVQRLSKTPELLELSWQSSSGTPKSSDHWLLLDHHQQ
jgi:hypothetical protein